MNPTENEHNYTLRKYRTPDGAPSDIAIFTMTTAEKLAVKKGTAHLGAAGAAGPRASSRKDVTLTASRCCLTYSQRAAQLYRITDYNPQLSIYS